MIKLFTTLGAVLVGLLAQAQTTIATFDHIEVMGNVKLIFTQTARSSVSTESPNVSTQIKGNTLYIQTSGASGVTPSVYVSGSTLRGLKAADADVTLANVLVTPRVSVKLTGDATLCGNIRATEQFALQMDRTSVFNSRVDTPELNASLNDAAKMCVTGAADRAEFRSAQKTLISARNFSSPQLQVIANDESKVQLHAVGSVGITVSEQARVSYVGMPVSVKMNENAIAIGDLKSPSDAVAGN